MPSLSNFSRSSTAKLRYGICRTSSKNSSESKPIFLQETLRKYNNRAIETSQVIEELIQMAKEFQAEMHLNEFFNDLRSFNRSVIVFPQGFLQTVREAFFLY
jgi:hypothetical protein